MYCNWTNRLNHIVVLFQRTGGRLTSRGLIRVLFQPGVRATRAEELCHLLRKLEPTMIYMQKRLTCFGSKTLDYKNGTHLRSIAALNGKHQLIRWVVERRSIHVPIHLSYYTTSPR